jgi:transposase
VLSTVPAGACRPCPISPEETTWRACQHPPHRSPSGRHHLDRHLAAVLDHTGRLLGTQSFPASTRGDVALVTWAERFGPVQRVGVEGTGTDGAGLTRFVRAYGLEVVEVARPDRSLRRRQGKSDPIDAQAAARATLAGSLPPSPRPARARSR